MHAMLVRYYVLEILCNHLNKRNCQLGYYVTHAAEYKFGRITEILIIRKVTLIIIFCKSYPEHDSNLKIEFKNRV